jgi:hypothetical protein
VRFREHNFGQNASCFFETYFKLMTGATTIGIISFGMTTLSLMPLGMKAISVMSFGMTTLYVMPFSVMTQHNSIQHHSKIRSSEYGNFVEYA